MKFEEIKKINNENVMNTYGRQDIAIEKGVGTKVWDSEGKEYLDFLSGLAVTSLGHSNPKVVSAICEQAKKIIHTSNLYYIENQAKLAKILTENTVYDKVFFCNSGAEANEGAIKLARKYGKMHLNGAYEIITMKNSFHGRTIATITATGQKKYQKDFTPLPEGFNYVEFGNIDELKSIINNNTVAIMIEAIQGEGGVNTVSSEYWEKLQELVDEKGVLLIMDEVQSGCGRTGKFLAQEHYNINPDITTMAKAMSNGMPIGAVLAKEKVSVFVPGDHASTFGGNHLSTAAGIATVSEILSDGFLNKVQENSKYFFSKLEEIKSENSVIEEIRGLGMLIGVKIPKDMIGKVVDKMRNIGILIGSAGGVVIRFAPPLTVNKDEIDIVVDEFRKILKEV